MLWNAFLLALRELRRNKMRSFLTMLGIIIGVGSVVLMSSIGASMQGVILSQISSLGAKRSKAGDRGVDCITDRSVPWVPWLRSSRWLPWLRCPWLRWIPWLPSVRPRVPWVPWVR